MDPSKTTNPFLDTPSTSKIADSSSGTSSSSGRDPNAIQQIDLEKKIKTTVNVLSDIQMGQKSKSSQFSAHDSILASKFTNDAFKFNRNIFIQNIVGPTGKRLIGPYCQHLVACTERDLVFASYKSPTGSSVVQVDVKKLLTPSPDIYKLQSQHKIGVYPNTTTVDQILPIVHEPVSNEPPEASVVCLVRSFGGDSETTSLSLNSLIDLNSSDLNIHQLEMISTMAMEFDEPYLCCHNHFGRKLALGGESKIVTFDIVNDDNGTNLNPRSSLESKSKCTVQTIKFDQHGNSLYCGTDTGELLNFDLINNQESQAINLKCGPIINMDRFNENELIIQASDNNLFKIDLRFCDQRRYLLKFDGHVNNSRKIKFSIDRCFNTITCPGSDNTIRIWSIESGQLIRRINFDDIYENVKRRKFTNNYLLDTHFKQVCDKESPLALKKAPNTSLNLSYYIANTNAQYHAINSSEWKCLNKQPKPLMIGSISDSLDLYY